MMQRFTCVLLNAKGLEKYRLTDESSREDEFNRKAPCLIDTSDIASVFPSSDVYFGRTVCRITLKSGDNFDLLDTFEEIEQKIKQSRVVFS